MLLSDLSSGNQAASPHITGCLQSMSVDRQQSISTEVSIISQEFADDQPAVNIK